jgi:hypothetical protein
MEEIEVNARFLPGGSVIPLNFIWKDTTYKVDTVGRNWSSEDGFHILVMDMNSQVFHLVFFPQKKIWYLIPGWDSRSSFA